MSIWEEYRDILSGKHDALMAEYKALADMGTDEYLANRGLGPLSRSKSYFYNRQGRYLDMKAPIRTVLEAVPNKPSSYQSQAFYKAMTDLGYPVVHDKSATGSLPLSGEQSPKEQARYSALARPDQAQFRKAISKRFGHKCWVSECNIPQALEAAHITPYAQGAEKDPGIDSQSNGLLLRRDIHALFDAGLISFIPLKHGGEYKVIIAESIIGSDIYGTLHNKALIFPKGTDDALAFERLAERNKEIEL